MEIERTKVAHLEVERKLENSTAANDRLKRDRADSAVERDALVHLHKDELLARTSDLEQMVTAGEAASSAALAVPAERSSKLEQTERDLDDTGALHALNEQLPAIWHRIRLYRPCLHEVEQQRAAE